ncbi:YbaL family putative K(+) efflux transporter [Gellertiella hungarica]|uniref:CPA2 family monovalent cation:H+ antiporter-2 n=1 Tax=Gellertiella hungarica TaxID=1572859 RepID=A0A7W6J5Z3_9HYPH|nr:YbaL family putative K(+) efflux transporter [Gellertiella hungarica]MBB4065397.1 CPA2 family monovalent cation:H+ antiporter-2 [Gellertiella hungarica]
MPHHTPLIATISIGLALAFLLGLIAQRLRLPSIVGYLLAGVFVGPFTPGFVADQKLAAELAEIGVILLMFGVGLHFSLKDLLSVRTIAIPGAIGQIAVATLLGAGLAWLLGWGGGAGLLFGLSLSVASTVVLLRALQERREVETGKGRIAVGWLIVEDLVMVLTLVLVPPLAGLLGGRPPADTGSLGLVDWLGIGPVWATLLLTAVKVVIFVALMLVVGRKVIPWILHYVAHTGSRELFRLAVLAIALGVAYGSANLFGVSFALGAFFAGMVLAESQLSHQAAKETLPLRDAFAVLFFVSVGMLFNPSILVSEPLAVLATFLIIALGKSAAAYAIVRAFGHPNGVALTISASLAQIGEFSFILIVLAVNLGIVPAEARDLVVAGSILSILLNPLMFIAIDRLAAARTSGAPDAPLQPDVSAESGKAPTTLAGHVVLVGHGRVGSAIAAALKANGDAFLVVEENEEAVASLEKDGIETHVGPCGETAMLERLNFEGARCLITAIPDPFEAGHVVEAARAANPAIRVIARAHATDAVAYLTKCGADVVVMGEEELARSMAAAAGAAGAPGHRYGQTA